MASASFEPEPDLSPLYPTPATVSPLLSPNFGLEPGQKAQLVAHCLVRACVFGELPLLTYLLRDPHAQPHVDLCIRDEEDVGLISTTIFGFGADSDRDIEREECVRLLLSEGADAATPDKAGWTPLHYAAVLSPPTLVSHFLKSGCSPFVRTCRKLTALDLVTGHSLIPGRETVALLLEEAMRSEGWAGGRMEERRKALEERTTRLRKRHAVREDINQTLCLDPAWWGESGSDIDSDGVDESELDEEIYTPQKDLGSMLAFSPAWLPEIFHSLITNFPITVRNSEPASALYLLARFACLYCDQAWLENLVTEAADTIEDTFFDRPDDLPCLVFWLYNTTLWLHLMKCDKSINQTCEALGSFEVIEDVINSIFVFIIRKAEKKIDGLLDAALLDHTPLLSEFDSVQFESEWSIFRPFAMKKKPPTTPSKRDPPSSPFETTSPLPSATATPSKSLQQSIRNTFSRGRNGPTTPLQSVFPDSPPGPTPKDITSHLTAFHTLLTLSGINPAFITQFWSQVMYWTACETFNRILTRKKFLCRSRAIQVSMNVSVLEEWVGKMGLPRGVQSHFAPVRDLLNWLQCLSSINDFSNLIATVQTMRNLNPLQMRRAVRDYRYEVNEGRMTEECTQYLAQLQKDWEKHRVRLGVEALRKEMVERDRESLISSEGDVPPSLPSSESIPDALAAQTSVDMLFDRLQGKSSWEPAKPPEALGEFLDSRHMLPLFFPSDPKMLAALPGKSPKSAGETKSNGLGPGCSETNLASVGSRGPLDWTMGGKKVRDVGVGLLAWVDGAAYTSRWTRPTEVEPEEEAEGIHDSPAPDEDPTLNLKTLPPLQSITPLTRRKSSRRGRSIMLSTEEENDFGIVG